MTNCRPLLESGTMGAKGHVQVIVPHLTESYASQVVVTVIYVFVGLLSQASNVCLLKYMSEVKSG